MGWLWSSTPASSAPQAAQENSSSSAPLPSETPSFPEPSQTKPLSRDEIAEKELNSFLAELSADAKPSSTKYNRVPKSTPSQSSKPSNSTTPDSDLPFSEQLLPTTMSCRTAFDEAFYCNSFGGKFNDLYRYGGLESCSAHWNKFWFCMRTRTWSEPEKKEAIREYYRKVETAKYGVGGRGLSSENVWRSRERKVDEGEGGFDRIKPEVFEGSDEEWNRMEMERRRNKIRDLERGGVS